MLTSVEYKAGLGVLTLLERGEKMISIYADNPNPKEWLLTVLSFVFVATSRKKRGLLIPGTR